MLASLRDIPQADLFGYPYVYPFLFAPAFLWAFVRECPRAQQDTRLDDFARRMVVVSAALGCVMWMALVAVLEFARAGYLTEAVFWACFDASLALLELLRLGALGVLVLRARMAPADEVRRVVLFAVGFLIWSGAITGYALVEAFSPGSWLSNYRWTPAVGVVELLRFPGIALLWYTVLASRVPHPREVVRAFCMRLLARGRVLGALAAVSSLVLVWLVARRPEQTVGAVVADPLAQALAAATGVLLLLVLRRERLLVRLDAWTYPETVDQRKALAAAGTALARAGRLAAVHRTVKRTVWNGCGSPAALLVAPDPLAEAHDFRAPDTRPAPLPRASAIINVLEAAGGSLRVHPSDTTSFFGLLPAADAAWVVEADADVLVPVPGAGAELLGVLVVGPRFDSRPVRPVDVPFLEAVAAAAGLAVGRLAIAHGAGGQAWREEPPAQECPVCRCLQGAGDAPVCGCGSEYVEAKVPKLLAGKYRLARLLGSGGMGTVYLARDLRLDRDVAVKTLADMSAAHLQGLKPEARAMAMVSHPAVAQIHGIESWRSRPFLVVEFVGGGTLADRLDRERVPPDEALSMTTLLADALAALHEAGYVHGDVKPSNIGFTASGLPKLLDFGLARESADADAAGGTWRYLSPEVLAGRPADEADDIWSLCVVLHEMVTGEHPFGGGDAGEVADRIRRQRPTRPARPAAVDESSAAVTELTVSMLTAPRSAPPAMPPATASSSSSSSARGPSLKASLPNPKSEQRCSTGLGRHRALPVADVPGTSPSTSSLSSSRRSTQGDGVPGASVLQAPVEPVQRHLARFLERLPVDVVVRDVRDHPILGARAILLGAGHGQLSCPVTVEELLVLGVDHQQRNVDAAGVVDRPVPDDLVEVRPAVQVRRLVGALREGSDFAAGATDRLLPRVLRDVDAAVLPGRAREVERVGGGHLADRARGPRLVGGGPDGMGPGIAGTPVADAVDVDARLAFQVIERPPDVEGLIDRIDDAPDLACEDLHLAVDAALRHLADDDQLPVALAPPAVVEGKHHETVGGEAHRVASQAGLRAAPAVAHDDGGESVVLRLGGPVEVARHAGALAPDVDGAVRHAVG